MDFKQQELLELSPLGILICDSQHRVLWANDQFIGDMNLVKEDIIGYLYEALPIEAIDKNSHQIQLFDDSSPKPRKFQHWQTEINEPANATAHYFALERNAVGETSNVDRYRLPKRANWLEFLDYEVSRSRRYDNPLSLVKLHALIQEKPETITEEAIYKTVKDTLMDELRWADMIGNTSVGTFLMVLPETPDEALTHLKKKISSSITTQIESLSTEIDFKIIFGSAQWQKHDDSQKMLQKARNSLVASLEKL